MIEGGVRRAVPPEQVQPRLRGRPLRRALDRAALRQALDKAVEVGLAEERHRQARAAGEVDDAMARAAEDAVGPALQHVAEIDHQLPAGERGYIQPLAFHLHLIKKHTNMETHKETQEGNTSGRKHPPIEKQNTQEKHRRDKRSRQRLHVAAAFRRRSS